MIRRPPRQRPPRAPRPQPEPAPAHVPETHSKWKDIMYLLLLVAFTIGTAVLYTKNPSNILTDYSSLILSVTLICILFIFFLNIKNSTGTENAPHPPSIFDIVKFSVMFLCFVVLVLFLYIYNPGGTFIHKMYIPVIITFVTLGILILSYLFLFIYSKRYNRDNATMNIDQKTIRSILSYFVYSTISVIGTIAMIHWISRSVANATSASGIVKLIVNIIILLIIFGLLFKMIMKSDLYNQSYVVQFIVHSIFYIPCLFVSLIEKITGLFGFTSKLNLTPGPDLFKPTRIDYIVLVSVIVVSVMYFGYPYVTAYFAKQGGKLLLDDPVYTNSERTLASYIDLNNKETKYDNTSEFFDYTYAISFWVYIDGASPSMSHAYDKYTSLLNYGGKPNVMYNGLNNTMMITMESGGGGPEEAKTVFKKKGILLQKWNNIIINYNGGTVDIFYNGELAQSVPGIVPYMKYDTLTVGENDGLRGGICSVNYFRSPLNLGQIYYLNSFVPKNNL